MINFIYENKIQRKIILNSCKETIYEKTKIKSSSNTEVFFLLLLYFSNENQTIKQRKIILELIYDVIPKVSILILNSKIGHFINLGIKALKNKSFTNLIIKTFGVWLSRINFSLLNSLMKRNLLTLLLTLSSSGTEENRNCAKQTFQQLMYPMKIFPKYICIEIIKFTQHISIDIFQLINLADCLKPCIHLFPPSCNEVLLKVFFNSCFQNNDATLKHKVFHLLRILIKIWSKSILTNSRVVLLKKIFNELRSLNPKNNDKLLKPLYLKIMGKCLVCLYSTKRQFVWIKFLYFCTLLTKCTTSKCLNISQTGLKVWKQIFKEFFNKTFLEYHLPKNKKTKERNLILSKIVMSKLFSTFLSS